MLYSVWSYGVEGSVKVAAYIEWGIAGCEEEVCCDGVCGVANDVELNA